MSHRWREVWHWCALSLALLAAVVWAAVPMGAPVLYTASDTATVPILISPDLRSTGAFSASGTIAFTGDITPTALSGDATDYSPTGLSTATVLRLSCTVTTCTMNGLAGGADGRPLLLMNIGTTGTLVLATDTGTAANRFDFATSATMPPKSLLWLQYDGVASRWRTISAVGSDPLTPTVDEKAALAGNGQTPSAANQFLTDLDPTVARLDESTELVSPELATGSFIFNGAGAPAAGSCPHDKATYRNTSTLGDTYICYGVGENWHLIGAADNYAQIPDTIVACDASQQGRLRYKVNGSTVSDQLRICTKLPDGNYYWVGPPQVMAASSETAQICEASPANDFYTWTGRFGSNETITLVAMPAGYLTRLRTRTAVNIPTGQTLTTTLRKNQADTAITCSQTNSQSCGTGVDAIVVTVAEGDLMNFGESCTTGGAATTSNTTILFYPL